MSKQLQNLIDKHGAEKLKSMIDQQVKQKAELIKISRILDTHESAAQWFENYCKELGYTCVDVYDKPKYKKYNKSCLMMNGWNSNGPYVYLWLNKNQDPHFEIGSSIYDIWPSIGAGYDQIIENINKVIKLREEA